MQSPLVKTKFTWLCDSEEAFAEYSSSSGFDIPKTVIPMPENIGNAWITSIHGALNIILRRYTYHSNDKSSGVLYQLYHVFEELAEPVLVVRSISSGLIIVHDRLAERKLILREGECLFQRGDSVECQITIDGSKDFDAFVLIIGDSVLNKLLGNELARILLRQLGLENAPEIRRHKVPQHISNIQHSSMPDTMTGNIGKMFAQARALEYLCALAEHITCVSQELPILQSDTVISSIVEELINMNGRLPTIDQLGVVYGISPAVMNDKFQRLYGQTMFSYIVDQRFERAREAVTNDGKPLKAIASDIGYSHVNHFITAFRKKFGITPGSLRKK